MLIDSKQYGPCMEEIVHEPDNNDSEELVVPTGDFRA